MRVDGPEPEQGEARPALAALRGDRAALLALLTDATDFITAHCCQEIPDVDTRPAAGRRRTPPVCRTPALPGRAGRGTPWSTVPA